MMPLLIALGGAVALGFVALLGWTLYSFPSKPKKSDFSGVVGQVPVVYGPARVDVTEAKLGIVDVKTLFGVTAKSEKKWFVVRIKVDNISADQKFDYAPWSRGTFSADQGLYDDLGNNYHKIGFGLLNDIKGEASSRSMYPGDSVTDILVFEPPVDPSRSFRLILSGKEMTGGHELTFIIPAGTLTRE